MSFLAELRDQIRSSARARALDALLAEQIANDVTRALCRDRRGARPYITALEDAQRRVIARDRQLVRRWREGESLPLLARVYGLSRQRVWQIVRARTAPAPAGD